VWREYNRGATLSSEQTRVINEMKKRLDSVISSYTLQGKDVFVRLSTRSPKDAVDKWPEKLSPELRQELLQMADEVTSPLDTRERQTKIVKAGTHLDNNARLIALKRAFSRVLKMQTAEDVFELMSRSSRAISDLKRAIDYVEHIPWNLKFIVREFVFVPIEGEFRGFVHNKSLNALSQYYTDCYFPQLPYLKTRIQQNILQFFETIVKPAIPYDNYIIDFAFYPSTNEVKIIELNPFSSSTGSALFHWVDDENVLLHGPFEIRIVEHPPRGRMGREWSSLIEKEIIRMQEKDHNYERVFYLGVVCGVAAVAVVFTAILLYKRHQRLS